MSAALEETTVSLNDSPHQVPLSAFHEAVKRVVRRAPGKQRDLEDPDQLGTRSENDEKIAQAEGIAADRLRSLVERIERLEEEKKALSDDIKDIYVEAKSAGFVPAVVRDLIKLRKKEPAEVEQHELLLDTYRRALGM